MNPAQDRPHVEAEGEIAAEPRYGLPPISLPARPRCRSCRRDDRPVFGTVCGWCSERE